MNTHLPSQPNAVTRASASAMCPTGQRQVSSPNSHRIERLCRLVLLCAPSTHNVIPLRKCIVVFRSLCRLNGNCAFTGAISSNSLRSRRSEEHTSELQSHSDLVCRL